MELDRLKSMEGFNMRMQRRTWMVLMALGTIIGFSKAQAKAYDSSNPSAKVIYGDDNRLDLYEVQEQNKLNWAASTVALMRAESISINGNTANIRENIIGQYYNLCTDEPFYDQNSAAFCSGFLVDENTIVTAGHCVRSQDSCNTTKFVFGFAKQSPSDRTLQVPAQEVYSCKQLVHSVANSYGEDFAVVKLDRPVVGHSAVTLASNNPEVGAPLTVIGHPSGLPTKVSGGAEVRSLRAEYLVANLDTYGGNSGSAVFNTNTGAVEGILVRGESDYVMVGGCRKSKVCTSTGCRGEDVTLIKQAFPYLSQ